MTHLISNESKKFYVAGTIDGHYSKFSPSGLKRTSETCKLPRPQPLAVIDLSEERELPICTVLDLSSDLQSKVLSHLFSFKEYMEYALYDPDFGYYTTRPGIGSDFYTTPMKNSPHYGACLAEMVFRQRQGMIEAGTFNVNERFDVVELGAGTGVLARDFVQHVQEKSEIDPQWKIFYSSLQYMTGEISPDLQEKQKATTEKFQDKVKVIPADARKLEASFGKNGVKGMIISNELPDAFSCHKIMKSAEGKIFVAVAVPVVRMFDHFLTGYPEFLSICERELLSTLLPKAVQMNALLRERLKPENGFMESAHTPCQLDKEDGFLSKELYKEIRKLNLPFFEMRITWKEFWVPVEYFPEIAEMQTTHRDFFRTMDPGTPVPFNSDLRPFQEGCGAILEKGGQMITDYMYDNYDLKRWANGFRTYPSTEIHDYSTPPGEEDITSDVNATALAVEGVRAKFTPVLFCTEREYLSQLPDRYPLLKIRSQGLPFHVLIMRKEGTTSTYQPHVLTRPVTYRELFLKFSDWSCTAIPQMRYVNEKTTLASRQIFEFLRKNEANNLGLNDIQQLATKILATVQSRNSLLENAVHSLLLRAVFFKPNLLTIAREHTSVADFDYMRVRHYFSTKANSDQVDRLMIQLVHHVLHLHYTS